MGEKATKKQAVSCSGAKKPLSSFVHGQSQCKVVSNEHVEKLKVTSQNYYRTRIVFNSSMKQSNIQSLMAMSKDKAVKLCNKVCKSVVTTSSNCKDFAQDGRQCYTAVEKTHSLCDGCLYSSVVAGSASDEADTQHIATSSGHIAEDTERGQIDSPICQSSVGQHAVHSHKVVAAEMLDDSTDQKMRIFDINGLEHKYLNTILNRSGHSKIPSSDTQFYKEWKVQSDFNFGFIPIGEFRLSHYCPIQAHLIVKQHGKPNYLGARLKVDSQLNLQAWEYHLSDYWDKQLIDLLYFGFPLDFNRNCPLKWEGVNHNSAINHPNDIDVYLLEELAHKAIVGPFREHPCPEGHISPLLTREKPNSANRRVIVDLSWPQDLSVNGGIDKNSYLGTDFSLHLPTIDHITEQLKILGRGCHLYKTDISRAFRHIKVDPIDCDLLGLSCEKWVIKSLGTLMIMLDLVTLLKPKRHLIAYMTSFRN